MPDKKYAPEFKAKVTLAALSGKKTATELSREFDVPRTLIDKWAKQLKESAKDIFYSEPEAAATWKEKEPQKINAKIGQLTQDERDFLLKSFEKW